VENADIMNFQQQCLQSKYASVEGKVTTLPTERLGFGMGSQFGVNTEVADANHAQGMGVLPALFCIVV
jgi:hypothetical protein